VNENQELVESKETEAEMQPADEAKEAMLDAIEGTYRPGQSREAEDEGSELPAEKSAEPEAKASEKEEPARIDLNEATVAELSQLPGIGPALAQRIIDYRTQVHPFEEPGQITAVSGISETTYAQIADRLAVGIPGEVEAEVEAVETVSEPEEAAAPEEVADLEKMAEPEEVPEPEEIAEPEEVVELEEVAEPEEVVPVLQEAAEPKEPPFQPEEEFVAEEGVLPTEPEAADIAACCSSAPEWWLGPSPVRGLAERDRRGRPCFACPVCA
jgi:competence ComEA-like helix-hairpin-helix protein